MSRPSAKRKRKADSPMEYKMDHKRRGNVLIFNQKNFQTNSSTRHGTDKDRDNLKRSFQDLGFNVKVYNDKRKKNVLQELHNAAEMDHTDADCFVCIFLTHGEEGQISAYDDMIKIEELTDLFRGDQCKSLVGKPKIFIFQACAGKKYETPVTGMAGGFAADEDDEEVEKAANIYTIPAGADFLMCYSSAMGFYSIRNKESGSYYIQDLCETLQKHGSTLEITELLTMVNLKVSQRDMYPEGREEKKKQMPCFTSMLTKKLHFSKNK
ncbi:caspase-6-like isoform X2 [Tachysurus vachellii]|uniref:caspase-6-like isoform X2 n=1 Tax=Tachysurus vachellii TaxID=175792 RepID=UPI00296AD881|nr:caspase-6-like isoform X2 [Tachysurus vachellii]XP_060729010.1 caspase-6-like isoform X2 [Tachysurus vachellii]